MPDGSAGAPSTSIRFLRAPSDDRVLRPVALYGSNGSKFLAIRSEGKGLQGAIQRQIGIALRCSTRVG